MKYNELEYFFTNVVGLDKRQYNELRDTLYSILQTSIYLTLTEIYHVHVNDKVKKSHIHPSILFEWIYDPYAINEFVLTLLFSKDVNSRDKKKIIKAFFKHHLRNLKVMRVSAKLFEDVPVGFPTITLFYYIFHKKRFDEKIIKKALKYDSLTNYHFPTLRKYFLRAIKMESISEKLKLRFLLTLTSRLSILESKRKENKDSFLKTALLAFYSEKTITTGLLTSLTKEIALLLSMPSDLAVVLSIDKKVSKKDFPILVGAQPWFMNHDSWATLLKNFEFVFPSLVFELFTRIDDEEQKARIILELGVIATLPKSLFLSKYLETLELLKPVYSKDLLSVILQSLMQRIEDKEKEAIIEFGYTNLNDKTFIEMALKDKSPNIRKFAKKLLKGKK